MALKQVRQNKLLRAGDTVMVIADGHKKKRPLKGKVGKILRFVGANKDRAVVEGLNLMTHHEKAQGTKQAAGRVQREAGIHVSNVMYYADKLKKPVSLVRRTLEDGRKVRGYVNPDSEVFEQIDTK